MAGHLAELAEWTRRDSERQRGRQSRPAVGRGSQLSAPLAGPDPALVDTGCGRLRGLVTDDVVAFRGVPFAAPPIGERRFRPPGPPMAWEGVRDAVAFGPIATQPNSPVQVLEGGGYDPGEEDCLYLNVWAPVRSRTPAGELLPVMVWIHGGAFVAGSGSSRFYDGARFAASGRVVVVTFNYRLGALGFLDLNAAGPHYRGSGNCGLLDQLAALRWVQENIAVFGGDPDRVTVFGESAGAMSIGTMLAMPGAKGLFRQAILQSGATASYRTAAEAADVTARLLVAFGGSVEELVAAPVESVRAAQVALTEGSMTNSYLAFRPVVDGSDLPLRPDDPAVLDGGFDGRVLIGTNHDEMSLFFAFDMAVAMLDDEQLDGRAVELVGAERWGRLRDHYLRSLPGSGAKTRLYAAATDLFFRVPALQVAEALASSGSQVWMYRFDWPTPFAGGMLGATHALEVPFVWDQLDLHGVDLLTGTAPGRAELAQAMHDAWLAFAATGDPSTDRLTWPSYQQARRATMLFGAQCGIADDPDGATREAWKVPTEA